MGFSHSSELSAWKLRLPWNLKLPWKLRLPERGPTPLHLRCLLRWRVLQIGSLGVQLNSDALVLTEATLQRLVACNLL